MRTLARLHTPNFVTFLLFWNGREVKKVFLPNKIKWIINFNNNFVGAKKAFFSQNGLLMACHVVPWWTFWLFASNLVYEGLSYLEILVAGEKTKLIKIIAHNKTPIPFQNLKNCSWWHFLNFHYHFDYLVLKFAAIWLIEHSLI